MTVRKIVVTPGDGIGPEVSKQAMEVLKAVATRFDLRLEVTEVPIGGIAYEATGTPLPKETLQACKGADAILLGAVGGPQWESLDYSVRPERALLGVRSELQLYANLRPAITFSDLIHTSSLKPELIIGTDIMVIRELTGGIYFGKPSGIEERNGERVGVNTLVYSEAEIRRIAKIGFETAMKRKRKLTSVDKANVLIATELWRDIVIEVSKEYPEVELNHLYVDNAVMQLIRAPKQFDTIVTTNMFGDILSDGAAMLTGSIGMLPSASLGGTVGLYEPVHGSAPDLAGQDQANPLATILSVGMMMRYSFNLRAADELIQTAVINTIQTYRTQDIMAKGKILVGCQQMGETILQQLAQS